MKMKKKVLTGIATLIIVSTIANAHAKDKICDGETVSASLKKMFEKEQSLRDKFVEQQNTIETNAATDEQKSAQLYAAYRPIEKQDNRNQRALAKIVSACGWPRSSTFKDSAVEAAFFIVQHAPPKFQLRYLPLVEDSNRRGETPTKHLGLLEDKVRVNQNLPQIYGTQSEHDSAQNVDRLYPVEDPDHLNEKRVAAGFKPLDPSVIENRLLKFNP